MIQNQLLKLFQSYSELELDWNSSGCTHNISRSVLHIYRDQQAQQIYTCAIEELYVEYTVGISG
jgi:hypothetical protein